MLNKTLVVKKKSHLLYRRQLLLSKEWIETRFLASDKGGFKLQNRSKRMVIVGLSLLEN